MATFQKVAEVGEVAPGTGKAVEAGGQQIALFNISGTFYAIGDACTHRGGSLSEGELDGTTVTCPLHAARFDVTTGRNLGPPAPLGVPSYKVRVEGNEVQVEIP
ncbi:MAG TPA: non-heme iron oxygenase ferredoxin subunit [Candidatus Polarisedimenticolia bacterium]|nr:non-heme iron oxygenase ferredoxin subunit [Candidatus Polarisedimenticolia bacterium]